MWVYHDLFFATRIQINVSWSGSRSGSGPGQMIRIQPDPDPGPKHWRQGNNTVKHCCESAMGAMCIVKEARKHENSYKIKKMREDTRLLLLCHVLYLNKENANLSFGVMCKYQIID